MSAAHNRRRRERMDSAPPPAIGTDQDIRAAMREGNLKRKLGGARPAILPIDHALIAVGGQVRDWRPTRIGAPAKPTGDRKPRKRRPAKPTGTPLTAEEAAARQEANREAAERGPIGGYVGNID